METLRNRAALIKLFNRRGYRIGAEVGVFTGGFSSFILSTIATSTLYSIDPWTGEGMSHEYDGDCLYSEASAQLAEFGDRSIMIREYSDAASIMFDDASLDFVYIDANHRYEYIRADIDLWLPKVRGGGVLSGHDYSRKQRCGVIQAVDESFGDRVNLTRGKAPSWWVNV